MTPEAKFQFYRTNRLETVQRLAIIAGLSQWLMDLTITVPDEIAENLHENVRCDSRSDEYEIIEEFEKHLAGGRTVKLFDRTTLYIMTEAGGADYRSDDAVRCSNTVHELESIAKYSDGARPADFERPEGDLSFVGFTEREITSIIRNAKSGAESDLEKLRNIKTTMVYLNRQAVWPHSRLVKKGKFGSPTEMSGPEKWHKPLIVSEWWMSTMLVDPLHAKLAVESIKAIDRLSTPRVGEPDAMTYFGSHVSNKISIEAA